MSGHIPRQVHFSESNDDSIEIIDDTGKSRPENVVNDVRMDDEDGHKCVICLSIPLQDPTILNTCTHYFCFDCIQQWLYTNPTCPMCKISLDKLKHKLNPCPTQFPVDYKKVNGEE